MATTNKHSQRAELLSSHPYRVDNAEVEQVNLLPAEVSIPRDGYWGTAQQAAMTREELLDYEVTRDHKSGTRLDALSAVNRYFITPSDYITVYVGATATNGRMYYLTAYRRQPKRFGRVTEGNHWTCISSFQTENTFEMMVWIDKWTDILRRATNEAG